MASTGPRPQAAPAVAVVIPCYNHGAFLPEAVTSVREQTWPSVKCIVVDDGSTDASTLTVIADLERRGIHVLRQPNSGLSAARNTGIRASLAEFFVPLDADDRLHPRFIETLLGPMRRDPKLGYCYCHVRLFGAESRLWRCSPFDSRRLLAENLSSAAAVVRREAFDRVGGYRSDMRDGFEDWDFWVALMAAGYRGHCVPEPLFFYRKHAAGSMLSQTMRRREEMVHRMIDHHRGTFACGLGATGSDDDIRAALNALRGIYAIEDSRFWRTLGWLAGLGEMPAGQDPRQRLAQIMASRPYRFIQAIKRTSLYHRYARRKYGPDWKRADAHFPRFRPNTQTW